MHFYVVICFVRLPHQNSYSMLIGVRLLESFEAGLCYDIYFDRTVQSSIQLPGAIRKEMIVEIVLVSAINL